MVKTIEIKPLKKICLKGIIGCPSEVFDGIKYTIRLYAKMNITIIIIEIK